MTDGWIITNVLKSDIKSNQMPHERQESRRNKKQQQQNTPTNDMIKKLN